MLQTLDAAATAVRLPYAALADAIAQVLRDARAGKAQAPARLVMPVPGPGSLLLMPASNADIAITKMITVHPHNPARSLPAIHGEVVVMDAQTGVRRLLLDGPTVTAHRTAAVSLLAARLLAPEPAGDLLLIGSGAQARAHLEAFRFGLGTRRVTIIARTADSAEALVVYARQLGMDATAVAGGDATGVAQAARVVLPQTPLVVTATPSAQPVLPDLAGPDYPDGYAWSPHHFIAAVGAFRPDMAELPPRLCVQAAAGNRLYADTLVDLEVEAGDLLQAGVPWSRVRPLQQCVDAPQDTLAQAPPVLPVVFKSVGSALWDLAACVLALSKSKPV
ncbi:ornithine cyclodeaminase/mu-crystallin family protein [Ralstonia insidiosa]|uniref:Ornithine cyclodeaminase/mu-crystallin family protein n=1 Tax=Ralstonia insidiosa TaxID=190721 RepID=A0AAC9BKS8_9RALS|nr:MULTISPECIES: delta(1)-pyrroline-2-carboxylate reductase family protein [Ralstonia]ANH74320.1 ornithine cyclodeaminase/mu-crystallin family protein [Ralstonia insidiosa]EPX95483.1 ornithine cyclodeaminase [Ralstonia sp. AU12-08]MBY4707374.1 delta(1)-pyrroline-2-carboxylate reductase family protein [Ralstonia insidiosa]GAQ28737.1 ornithine cyclodeaminase [Ralstonia sp. NT80]